MSRTAPIVEVLEKAVEGDAVVLACRSSSLVMIRIALAGRHRNTDLEFKATARPKICRYCLKPPTMTAKYGKL